MISTATLWTVAACFLVGMIAIGIACSMATAEYERERWARYDEESDDTTFYIFGGRK